MSEERDCLHFHLVHTTGRGLSPEKFSLEADRIHANLVGEALKTECPFESSNIRILTFKLKGDDLFGLWLPWNHSCLLEKQNWVHGFEPQTQYWFYETRWSSFLTVRQR